MLDSSRRIQHSWQLRVCLEVYLDNVDYPVDFRFTVTKPYQILTNDYVVYWEIVQLCAGDQHGALKQIRSFLFSLRTILNTLQLFDIAMEYPPFIADCPFETSM